MPQVLAAVPGALLAAGGTAITAGVAGVAAGTTALLAAGAALPHLLGGVGRQIEADLRAEEQRRLLNRPRPDPARNVTAANAPAPYVYGTCRVGGNIVFLNAGRVRLRDNTTLQSRTLADRIVQVTDTRVSAQLGEPAFRVAADQIDSDGRWKRQGQNSGRQSSAPDSKGYKTTRVIGSRTNADLAIERRTDLMTFVRDDVLATKRPYMSIVLLISKGRCESIDEVYINGEHVPTHRIAMSGTGVEGDHRSGHCLLPLPQQAPQQARGYYAADADRKYYPNWEDRGAEYTRKRFTAASTNSIVVPTWPLFQVFEYFDADGTQGHSLFNATDTIENDDGDQSMLTRMRAHLGSDGRIRNWLNGYSWVHIYLDSIPHGNTLNYLNDRAAIQGVSQVASNNQIAEQITERNRGLVSERAFADIPQFEFLVNGRRITADYALGHLTQGAGGAVTLTRAAQEQRNANPAAILYDYMTEVQGFPQESINRTALRDAVSHCLGTVTITAAQWKAARGSEVMWKQYTKQTFDRDESQAVTLRYDAGGVVYEGEDSAGVLAELAFTMQGSVVDAGGQWYIRAGENRTATRTITAADVLAEWEIQAGPSIQDRTNGIDMGLAQSKVSRTTDEQRLYLATTLKRRVNASALRRDGQAFTKDLGNRRFVTDPVIAQRLMAIQLRRFEANSVYRTRISPGDDLQWLDLVPGDVVAINDAAIGLVAPLTEVLSTEVLEDLSLNVTLREITADMYDDTLDLPPVEEPTLVHPVVNAPVSVTDLTEQALLVQGRATPTEVRTGDQTTLSAAQGYARSLLGAGDVNLRVNAVVDLFAPTLTISPHGTLIEWSGGTGQLTLGQMFQRALTANIFQTVSAGRHSGIAGKTPITKLASGYYRTSAGGALHQITHVRRMSRNRYDVMRGSTRVVSMLRGNSIRSTLYEIVLVC